MCAQFKLNDVNALKLQCCGDGGGCCCSRPISNGRMRDGIYTKKKAHERESQLERMFSFTCAARRAPCSLAALCKPPTLHHTTPPQHKEHIRSLPFPNACTRAIIMVHLCMVWSHPERSAEEMSTRKMSNLCAKRNGKRNTCSVLFPNTIAMRHRECFLGCGLVYRWKWLRADACGVRYIVTIYVAL